MSNRLVHESSPYLLQHAKNPVDWYPWGDEALEKARLEKKPIFLSIGYAACHWCHVMAHESFEDAQTASFMNKHFINIKVDREERPDLDSIYMDAVVAMTGQGGWPMSIFLTPEGRPFFGGTYYPPVPRYNIPSFMQVLQSIANAWQKEHDRLVKAGDELTAHLRSTIFLPTDPGPLTQEVLEQASFKLAQTYDWKNGGWGQAPKFPQPMAIEFLLQRAAQGDKMALDISKHALDAMSRGGMYDVVGGGFSRYSTDNHWLVPHFEKMLYDNALLSRAYLHAYLLTGDPKYRRVCEQTLDFIIREMMAYPVKGASPQGGFFSSLDADSEGEEGKFYLWTIVEIRSALDLPQEAEFIIAAYGITPSGNFEGRTVLQRALDDAALAEQFNIPFENIPDYLSSLHNKLLAARSKRVPPNKDDKVLVSWNALALITFSEAARYLNRGDYLDVARQNADFLLTELAPQNHLKRSWRDGKTGSDAFLEDYAGLILGLIALYQSDPDPWWFRSATQLAEEMLAHFRDPENGFFDTHDEQDDLISRPKSVQDNAIPSGNALAAMALVQLSAYTGNGEWRDLAEEMLAAIQPHATNYPTAFSMWLCAFDLAVGPLREIAIIGSPDLSDTQAMIRAVWSEYRPKSLLATSDFPPAPNCPPLLFDRPQLDNQPTAYVCQNFVCKRPVKNSEDLLTQLDLQP
jgi:uncharacterized protein YyaL (SSP411 family)